MGAFDKTIGTYKFTVLSHFISFVDLGVTLLGVLLIGLFCKPIDFEFLTWFLL